MPGYLNHYPMRQGSVPLVTTRLPAEHAKVLRAFAARNGIPLQSVIKSLVADWYKVHAPVHGNQLPQPVPQPVTSQALPVTHRTREDTGRSETIEKLQGIDVARKEAAADGSQIRD